MIDTNSMLNKLRNEKKLVVFIGAGVSANSRYKSWQDLVRQMDIAIGYSANPDTKEYSNDELLRIPQYIATLDYSRYREILTNSFSFIPKETNPIIDLILELHPRHIITTNFDRLIEFSLNKKRQDPIERYTYKDYAVIKKEANIVAAKQENLLVKMHGDIDSIDEMVLQEKDYLCYSDKYPLIETFIKSLLIDHTFVFVGYGLNDINFKHIMQWVETAISRSAMPLERKHHLYVNASIEKMSAYDKRYFESKNVYAVENADLPNEYQLLDMFDKNAALQSLSDERGRNIYRIIKYIKDGELDKSNTLDYVHKKLAVFNDIPKIIFDDVLNILNVPAFFYKLIGNKVYYYSHVGASNNMLVIIEALAARNGCAPLLADIENVLCKAGLEAFENNENHSVVVLAPKFEYPAWVTSIMEHDYMAIRELVDTKDEPDLTQLFFYLYLGAQVDAQGVLERIQLQPSNRNIIEEYAYLHNGRHCLDSNLPFAAQFVTVLPECEKAYNATLVDFSEGFPELTIELNEIVLAIKNKYSPYSSMQYHEAGIQNQDFKRLSTKLHNLFEYFIYNRIYLFGLNRFSENVSGFYKLVSQYVETLLFLQSPCCNHTKYEEIKLDRTDIAFICTFMETRDIKQIISQYRITKIELDEDCQTYLFKTLNNVVTMQLELATANAHGGEFYLSLVTSNICELLSICTVDSERKLSIVKMACGFFCAIRFALNEYRYVVVREMYRRLLEITYKWSWLTNDTRMADEFKNVYLTIINQFNNENHSAGYSKMFKSVIQPYSILLNISNLLNKYNMTISCPEIDAYIETAQKYNSIYEYRLLVDIYATCDAEKKEIIKMNTYYNKLKLPLFTLYTALDANIIQYDTDIENELVKRCERQIKTQKTDNSGDWDSPLFAVLRMKEKGIIRSLKSYEQFASQNYFFGFVCFPNTFDYEHFDVAWHSWLQDKEYKEIAQGAIKPILKKKFERAIAQGATDDICATYYRLFFSNEGDIEI